MKFALKALCARLLIVGIRRAKLQTEWSRIVGIDIVKVSVLTGMLRRLRSASCGIGWAGGVPLACIGKAETMVLGNGIIHPYAVLMVGAVTAVARFIFVSNALIAQWMIGFVFHLSVICPIGESVRHVQSQFATIVDKAAACIACSIFVLPPTSY